MSPEAPSAAEIAQHYSAAEDSVSLINELVALSERNDEQVATVRRNVEHLQIMVAKDFWTDAQDLAPLNAAITAGSAVLPS